MDLSTGAKLFISLLYSVFLIFLYLFTFFVIIRHWKTEKSSFFLMYILEGVMNICTYFMVFYSKKLNTVTCDTCPLAFIYRDMNIDFLKNFLTCMSYHMAYVQYLNTSLISTNRNTVLRYWQRGEPFWKKFALPIMMIAFLLPFIDTHRHFLLQTEITYNGENYEFAEPMPLEDCFKYLNPTMIFCSAYSVGMNIGSRMYLRKLTTHVRSKASTNFIVITLFTSIAQVLGCFLSIIRVAWPTGPIARLLAECLPFVSDGLTLMQPLLLFVLASSSYCAVDTVCSSKLSFKARLELQVLSKLPKGSNLCRFVLEGRCSEKTQRVKTDKKGYGVKAIEDIQAGENLAEYSGELISAAEKLTTWSPIAI